MRTFLLKRGGHHRLTRSCSTSDVMRNSAKRSDSLRTPAKRTCSAENNTTSTLQDDVIKRECARDRLRRQKTVDCSHASMTSQSSNNNGKKFLLQDDDVMFSRKEMLWGPYPCQRITKQPSQTQSDCSASFIQPFCLVWTFFATAISKDAPKTSTTLNKQQMITEKSSSSAFLRYASLALYSAALLYVILNFRCFSAWFGFIR